MSSLIKQLRDIRQKQGLTQAELAEKIGIPQSSIARIESARIDTRMSTFEELIKALGYEIAIIPKEQVVLLNAFLIKPEEYSDLSQAPLYSRAESDAMDY